jgi:hypothetical protein
MVYTPMNSSERAVLPRCLMRCLVLRQFLILGYTQHNAPSHAVRLLQRGDFFVGGSMRVLASHRGGKTLIELAPSPPARWGSPTTLPQSKTNC